MNEIDFKDWLKQNSISPKVQGDYISRLRRLERALQIDLDEEYDNDICGNILSVFVNMGRNSSMEKFLPNSLPIGKYYLSTYKLAVKKYISYRESIT